MPACPQLTSAKVEKVRGRSVHSALRRFEPVIFHLRPRGTHKNAAVPLPHMLPRSFVQKCKSCCLCEDDCRGQCQFCVKIAAQWESPDGDLPLIFIVPRRLGLKPFLKFSFIYVAFICRLIGHRPPCQNSCGESAKRCVFRSLQNEGP